MVYEALYGVEILSREFGNVLAGAVSAFLSTLPDVPMIDSQRNVMAGESRRHGVPWDPFVFVGRKSARLFSLSIALWQVAEDAIVRSLNGAVVHR
jgi:hypothetical protein